MKVFRYVLCKMNLVTWNMQGSNASTEDKWNTQVATILNANSKPDFICLQESGGVPDSAVERGSKRVRDPRTGADTMIRYYEWRGTATRPGCCVVFHEWDAAGGRVNSAVVIRGIRWPEQMELVWGGAHDWRPALGIELEGKWTFSYHAISKGGPDAPTVVAAAAGLANPSPWVIAGDFNREPPFTVPGGSAIREPGGNTYSVKSPTKKYDYCVSTVAPKGQGDVLTSVLFSDHYPVLFQF